MRIGIFGGAFNPVHNGHINLAKSYIENLFLDKLIVIPTANPPHKSSKNLVSQEDRLNMLKLAFDNQKEVEVSDIEFKRCGKSYTFDTIKELRKVFKNDELFLIIGEDQFLSFDTWYRYEDILKDVTLCTGAREKNMRNKLVEYSKKLLDNKECFIADFEPIVLSSSDIREKVKNKEDIKELVPQKVFDYIIEKRLYDV